MASLILAVAKAPAADDDVSPWATGGAKTKAGDTERTILRGWAEQTLDLTCIDAPGVTVGSVVVVTASGANGHNLSSVKFLVTSVSQSEPLDDKTTFSVSCTRGVQ
jgi:hypothetical protein